MSNRSMSLLCEAILGSHFGFYVQTIGHALLNGDMTLNELRKTLRPTCKSSDICRALAILELHGMASFKLTNRGVYYSIVPENILNFIHLPRAIHAIKQLFGEQEANIVTELAFYGRATYEKCISSLLTTQSEESCARAFSELVYRQIVRKCDVVVSSENGFPTTHRDPHPFSFDTTPKPTTEIAGSRKRKLEDTATSPLWRINWPRFQRYLNNELVLSLIKNHKEYNRTDEPLWRSLLLVADSRLVDSAQQQSDPIAINEVVRYAKDNYSHIVQADAAKKIFEKLAQQNETSHVASTIIRHSGESGGGLFVINYAAAVEMFCNDHIESVLRERINDHAVRIFRLLRMHSNIEEDALPEMAMLESKEVKEICYLMLENGYIFSRAVPRTNDFAPSRSFYFYSYKTPELLSNMTNLCYDSLRNVTLRRLHEVKANKVLLETYQKVETIMASILQNPEIPEEEKAVQVDEVKANYMTEQDMIDYQKFTHAQRRMMSVEVEIGRTLLVFQMASSYNRQTSIAEATDKRQKKRRKNILDDL